MIVSWKEFEPWNSEVATHFVHKSVQTCSLLNFADARIPNADLWCPSWPLYQLSRNYSNTEQVLSWLS